MNTPGYFITGALQRTRYNTGRVLRELGLQIDRHGSSYTNDIAYQQNLSRHRKELPVYPYRPQTKGAWVAPNASLVGNVQVSQWATIWYNATLRAEQNAVRIGHFSSIGEGTVLNSNVSLPLNVPQSVNVGKNVTIGRNCSILSSVIDDDVVIGDNVTISEGCVIERGSRIEDGAIVPPGRLIPAGQLWGGNPATFVRELSEAEQLENYELSYTSGVTEETTGDLWPTGYREVEDRVGETIDEYVSKKYFRSGRF
jgi:carbonic anhydrase/acetyltransferase-like protein (isoleucine patch superfamily)